MAQNDLLESLGVSPKAKKIYAVQGVQASPNQVQNSDGLFVYEASPLERLRRFLILGSTATYYASSKQLTAENKKALEDLIDSNGVEAVAEIVAVSDSGRAPKNDYALYALSVALTAGKDLELEYRAHCAKMKEAGFDTSTGGWSYGSEITKRDRKVFEDKKLQLADTLEQKRAVKRAAFAAIGKVARIGTHRLQLASYIDAQRGWGHSLRKAFSEALTAKTADELAYDMLKYRDRENWNQRDILQRVHPKATSPAMAEVFRYVDVSHKRGEEISSYAFTKDTPTIIKAYHAAKNADESELVELIKKYNMPLEMIASEKHSNAVYRAILSEKTPITWLVRNLGNLTKMGVLGSLNPDVVNLVCDRIEDVEALRKGRVHPLALLVAYNTYKSGKSVKGSGEWTPVPAVMKSLEKAFYLSFQSIVPANKRLLLALDISGSMGTGEIAGMTGITPMKGSAAMALVTARTERFVEMMAFTGVVEEFKVPDNATLQDVENKMVQLSRRMGSTDCSLAMKYALDKKLSVDCFIMYTDSETNHGRSLQPAAALKEYRKKSGIKDAKLIVVGMVSNGFTVADPNDRFMMDVVGFDTAAPAMMADFAAGRM